MVKTKRTSFNIRKLCTPANIYFIISLISLIILGVTNLGDTERLCVGNYNCYVGNNTIVFASFQIG